MPAAIGCNGDVMREKTLPTRRALVVERSKVDRRVIGSLLEDEVGMEVEFARDGASALARLAAEAPDLVVTELEIPEMDGLELIRAVKSRHPLVPVVIVTSQGSEELAVRALRNGAASYVAKRSVSQDLVETVEGVLAAALQERNRFRLLKTMSDCESSFVLGNDRSLFGPLVAYLQEQVGMLGLCNGSELTRLGVALEEALSNAAEHGNLELDSTLRENDREAYDALTRERLGSTPYRERRVHVRAKLTRSQAMFEVRDEGRGFDPESLPDPTDPQNLLRPCGRGVMLMRTFMDEVRFSYGGRQVTLIKRKSDSEIPDPAAGDEA